MRETGKRNETKHVKDSFEKKTHVCVNTGGIDLIKVGSQVANESLTGK